MDLIFWWMIPVWLGLFIGYWLVRYVVLLYKKSSKIPAAVPIAHSDRLLTLPAYRSALRRYKLLAYLTLAIVTLAVGSGIFLSARPAKVTVIEPVQQSRDIMLCLDVSGSMLRTDTTIINRFGQLVKEFDGQRIGLVVFNSSSIVIVPLSDDYPLINQQLERAGAALHKQKGQDFVDLTSGTLAQFDNGTSLTSDGLVSCMNNLGENPQQRSQSVILATDNEMNGTAIFSLEQATTVAKERNIRVYAIDPGESETGRAKDHDALKTAVQGTGGHYFKLSSGSAVSSIVNDISSQEAEYASTAPTAATIDAPTPFIILATVATLLSVLLTWRLRL